MIRQRFLQWRGASWLEKLCQKFSLIGWWRIFKGQFFWPAFWFIVCCLNCALAVLDLFHAQTILPCLIFFRCTFSPSHSVAAEISHSPRLPPRPTQLSSNESKNLYLLHWDMRIGKGHLTHVYVRIYGAVLRVKLSRHGVPEKWRERLKHGRT